MIHAHVNERDIMEQNNMVLPAINEVLPLRF